MLLLKFKSKEYLLKYLERIQLIVKLLKSIPKIYQIVNKRFIIQDQTYNNQTKQTSTKKSKKHKIINYLKSLQTNNQAVSKKKISGKKSNYKKGNNLQDLWINKKQKVNFKKYRIQQRHKILFNSRTLMKIFKMIMTITIILINNNQKNRKI